MSRCKKQISNQKGSMILESLVAGFIFSIVIFAIMSSVTNVRKQIAQLSLYSQRDYTIYSMLDSLKNNIKLYTPNLYLVTANPDTNLKQESILNYFSRYQGTPTNLPMAFSKNGIFEAAQCPLCEGRFGFVVSPMDSMKGLYHVYVLVTLDNGLSFKQYEFIAGNN